MLRIPNTYNGENIHRVVLTLHTLPGTDFARIEDIAADAMAEARAAAEALEAFDFSANRQLDERVGELKQYVDRRSILTDDFRTCARAILEELGRLEVDFDQVRDLDQAGHRLHAALDLSDRVSDLAAADDDLFRRMRVSR